MDDGGVQPKTAFVRGASALRVGQPHSCTLVIQVHSPEMRFVAGELNADLYLTRSNSLGPHHLALSSRVSALQDQDASGLYPFP
jgi:hypothetical protein